MTGFSSYEKSLSFRRHLHLRKAVNHQVSLLYLTLEAGIPGDVMSSLIDGKHIVYVPQHDELLEDRVDDGPDEEIDGIAAEIAMLLKEVPLAALDRPRITREVKQLSELVRKMNDRQICFESDLKLGPGPTEYQRIDLMPEKTTQ